MTAPLFLAPPEALAGDGDVVLEGAEAHHAVTVRRLRAGEAVDVADGDGLLVHGTVAEAGRDRLVVAVRERRRLPEPSPRVVVVQALPKGDRGPLAVELLAEAGADEVVPWAAARCVTRWEGARGEKALQRWRSSAREAGKQSRRVRGLRVAELLATPAVAARAAQAALAVVLHEEAEESLAATALPAAGEVLLVVGPEGGVADAERDALREAGAREARLGPTVLRTSTAGVVAASHVLARTGRWAAERA